MYVIVDWHILSDGNPLANEDAAKAFFAEVSERYKGSPNVIYEICNEPNGGARGRDTSARTPPT
jgi:endoglucanase